VRVFVLLGVALSGCAYQAGSFHSASQSFPGSRASIDCLDLAIERRPDLPTGEVVLGYAFGNRCDRPAVVDLARVAVVGAALDGSELELQPYDPHGELAALRIDARAVGREAIAYHNDTPLAEVCVDAGAIAQASTTSWVCLASPPQLLEVP
jgi:hypothetical protein